MDQPKTIQKIKQNAARAAETGTKYIKQHKTAKRPETGKKVYKTKQNAGRTAETSAKYIQLAE